MKALFGEGECEDDEDEEGVFACANDEMTFSCDSPGNCCFDIIEEGDDMPSMCCNKEVGCCLSEAIPEGNPEEVVGLFECFGEEEGYLCESGEPESFDDCVALPAQEFMY